MSVLEDIRSTIIDISQQGSDQRTPYHIGKVKSVSDDGETCAVICGETEWTDVRITAVSDGECDVKMYPKVGSFVMLVDLSNGSMSDLAVAMYSKFDKIELGEAKHTAANADVLKKELLKLTKRVDAIFDAIRNGTTTAQDGGAAYKSSMTAILGTATDKEDWSGIENSNIKH